MWNSLNLVRFIKFKNLIFLLKMKTKFSESKVFIILLIGLFLIVLIPLVNAEEFGYNYLDGELNVAQAINYTLVSVNDSIYWDGHAFSYLASNYVPYTGATADLVMPDYSIWGDTLRGNNVWIWDDTLNVDGILSVYTHDLSNSFVLTVNDAGSTDFYSTDMYQFRSGDNDFQFMHNAYTGTYLDIMVDGVNPEIESESNEISFVDNNLTTTGNITASNFFGTFIGSLTNKITKIFTTDIEASGQLNLTNGSYSNRIYTDSNGTLVFYFD